MKKNSVILLLALALISPVMAEDIIDTDVVPVINSDIQQKQSVPFKQPTSKKALIKKFLYAMGGVTASSLILYFGLTAYNRLRYNVIKTATSDYSNTLNTPDNLKDAVNIYLEKTRN